MYSDSYAQSCKLAHGTHVPPLPGFAPLVARKTHTGAPGEKPSRAVAWHAGRAPAPQPGPVPGHQGRG